LSQIDLKRYDEAFATLRALQADGHAAEVLNAMGVVRVRSAAAAQSNRPTYYFSQASQTDSSDEDYFSNLGYAYAVDKDLPAAIYWLREGVRRDPADGDAHHVLSGALQQRGETAEAARERELAERLSARSLSQKSRTAAEIVPRGLERLKDYLERPA